MDVRQRYNTDAMFHAVVDMLYAIVLKSELTPSELREALILACVRYEERNPRPIMMPSCYDCGGSGLVDNALGRPVACKTCRGTGIANEEMGGR